MSKTREKMPPAHRAKQFMPFAAVKGLGAALAEKETAYAPRIKLAEDAEDDVNRMLSGLFPGSFAQISYYAFDECKTAEGEILYIDTIKRRLGINGENVNFSDIISVCVPDDIPYEH